MAKSQLIGLTTADRQAYAEVIGAAGRTLLTVIFASSAPTWLREVPAIQILRQVWVQNYTWREGKLAWRDATMIPPAERFIGSPYDVDAHYAMKRSTSWVGYKVHLTETCDEDSPQFITPVETMSGPGADGSVVGCIHETLKEKDLLPSTHFVDMGYVDSELLANSQQEYGVNLFGPARGDIHEQARVDEGFDARPFTIDWEAKHAICPAGSRSVSWTPAVDNRDNDVIKLTFALRDCRACAHQAKCTTSSPPRRTLTIRPRDQYLALQAARARQETEEFWKEYGTRSGIEGTRSQGIRAFGMQRSRYIGQAKTHLQHMLTATAMNVVRASMWLAETPRAKTRQSSFVRLHQRAA